MYGQILVMAGIVALILIFGMWDKLTGLDELWKSQPVTTKIFVGIAIIAYSLVAYSYFDKSIKLQVSSKRIETRDDIIKWEEVHEALVNHQEYHKGRILFTMETGSKKKLDISGLELKPDEIADELSNYWSANRQVKNV